MIETTISIQKYIYNIYIYTYSNISISKASNVYIYKQCRLKNLWASTKEVKYQKYYNIQEKWAKTIQ